MCARRVLILGLVALATAPVCVVLFADGRDPAAARPPVARAATAPRTIGAGCLGAQELAPART